MLIPFPPLSSDPNNIWGDKWLTCNSSQIKGIKKKKVLKTTHSSKANREKMHLLNMELCYWKPASWFSVLDSPGSLRQRVGKTLMLKSGSAFRLRYQDSPVQGCTVASPGPLLRWKSVQYSMAVGSRHCRVWPEAVGHWQWSSMVLIHYSRLQGGLHQFLGGAFPFFSPICWGVLENEVAVKCFNGGRWRCLCFFSFHRWSRQFPPLLPWRVYGLYLVPLLLISFSCEAPAGCYV